MCKHGCSDKCFLELGKGLSSFISHNKEGEKLACLSANMKAAKRLGDEEAIDEASVKVGETKELLYILIVFWFRLVSDGKLLAWLYGHASWHYDEVYEAYFLHVKLILFELG